MENPNVSVELKRDKDGLLTSVQCKVEPTSGKDAADKARLASLEIVAGIFESESDQPLVYVPVEVKSYRE